MIPTNEIGAMGRCPLRALRQVTPFAMAMMVVVAASNVLVSYPLGDWLTWGAFTYPVAFLVTDLTNRRFGVMTARWVVALGFALAVVLSLWLATPRIALASGAAFLIAQLLDIAIFDRLRTATWWRAPFISSVVAGALDTLIFFALAFSAAFGPSDEFATEMILWNGMAARWVGWAIGDYLVKLAVALLLLAPYRWLQR